MREVRECVINREKGEYCFTSAVGLPTPPVIDGVRTHHVASNMAGAGGQSTNTLDPFHSTVFRLDDDRLFGPKARTSDTSSSVSAQDTHEANPHRLCFYVDTKPY